MFGGSEHGYEMERLCNTAATLEQVQKIIVWALKRIWAGRSSSPRHARYTHCIPATLESNRRLRVICLIILTRNTGMNAFTIKYASGWPGLAGCGENFQYMLRPAYARNVFWQAVNKSYLRSRWHALC